MRRDSRQKFTIQRAGIESSNAIATVHIDSWRATYRGHIPDDYLDQLSVSARTEFWKAELAREENRVFIAMHNDSICGFIHTGLARDEDLDDRTGEVYAVYLLSDFQGVGLGVKLWEEATRHLRNGGVTRCVAWVLDTNQTAISFYQRVGCRPDGARKCDVIGGREVTELRYQVSLV